VAKSLAGWVSRAQGPWRTATVTRVVVGILAIGIATGSVVDVYRIGDSGAKAAWHDSFSKTASGSAG
jgi:hypothetical protein